MQNDAESVPEDVLRALVADGQTVAPGESRARVLARLGVAAAAGAAALAHASVASAAAGKAAGHSAAPAAASVLGFGVAKMLIAHPVIGIVATLAVGSGVGIGAYQAFEPGPAPAALATPHAGPAKKSEPALAAMPAHEAPLQAAPVAPAPEAFPPAVPETLAETHAPSRPANAPRAPSVKGTASAELAPAPDLPRTTESARLAEQQALLDQARASLRRGDGSGALAVIAGHESLYPVTEFAEERAAIRILALVMSGRGSEARAHAERFRERFPTSLFLPAIEKSLAPVAPSPAPTPHDSPKPE
jgi:hypothetical protein